MTGETDIDSRERELLGEPLRVQSLDHSSAKGPGVDQVYLEMTIQRRHHQRLRDLILVN